MTSRLRELIQKILLAASRRRRKERVPPVPSHQKSDSAFEPDHAEQLSKAPVCQKSAGERCGPTCTPDLESPAGACAPVSNSRHRRPQGSSTGAGCVLPRVETESYFMEREKIIHFPY